MALRVHQHVRRGRVPPLYERYHIPASGPIFWGSALANIHPGKDDTWVDYTNDDRAPLLFISGDEDHLMPPKIQQSNAKHYTSDTITEVKEFAGPHLLPAAPGWETVADDAPSTGRYSTRPSRAPREAATHIGGPTVLVEVAGLRLLTDPTFDPAGAHVSLRLGDVVATSSRARRSRRATSAASTRSCSPTTITATTSTRPGGPCSRRPGPW